jgi:hypothetical protein
VTSLFFVLALAAPLDAPADAKPAKALRIAVYPIKGDDQRLATLATESVATEIRKLQHVSVVAMDEIKAMLDLEAQKQMIGCSDESCLAEIADSLGVDGIVIGDIANVSGQMVFGMKRIDQRSAKTVASSTKQLPEASGEAVLAQVGPVVAELFPDVPLRPGAVRGVDKALARKLNPPPIPVWGFGAAAAGTALVALVAAGAGAFNLYLVDDYQKFLTGSVTTPVPGKDVTAKAGAITTSGVVALSALGATVVAGAGLGVMSLFTDWYDDAGSVTTGGAR